MCCPYYINYCKNDEVCLKISNSSNICVTTDEKPLTAETERRVVKSAERRAESILRRLSSRISNRLVRYV